MATENIAIVISIISVGVASLSLGWNIYRDLVLKAKVQVDLGIRTILHSSMPDRPKFVGITVTNFGPGSVNLSMIQAKNAGFGKWLLRKSQHAVIMFDYTNPLSARLPAKVEAGDRIDLLLPYNKDCFLKEDLTHVGISDFFGRVHWAPKKQIESARNSWLRDFTGET